jgi:hypothetical protein
MAASLSARPRSDVRDLILQGDHTVSRGSTQFATRSRPRRPDLLCIGKTFAFQVILFAGIRRPAPIPAGIRRLVLAGR